MNKFEPGALVIIGRRLGMVARESRQGSACGYDVAHLELEPMEGTAAHFAPDWVLEPAVLDVTVCRKPRGECWCGLLHIPNPEDVPEHAEGEVAA